MSIKLGLERIKRELTSGINEIDNTVNKISALRSEIKETHTNCNISKTVGTTFNAIGTGCMFFPPAAVVGLIAFAAGTACNVTTDIIRDRLNNKYGKKVLDSVNHINGGREEVIKQAHDLVNECNRRGTNVDLPERWYINALEKRDIEQVRSFFEHVKMYGEGMAAGAALVGVVAKFGQITVRQSVGPLGCVLVLKDIGELIVNWITDPALVNQVDDILRDLQKMKKDLKFYLDVVQEALNQWR
uniref:Apolipoprotein L3 n=1 Tax=Mesocestoides corti TaxID=53468 RepID=A0A5K3EK32_MESCO